MPIAGSTSPSWSNEDADDFWDDDLGVLDDEESHAPAVLPPSGNGSVAKNNSQNTREIVIDESASIDASQPGETPIVAGSGVHTHKNHGNSAESGSDFKVPESQSGSETTRVADEVSEPVTDKMDLATPAENGGEKHAPKIQSRAVNGQQIGDILANGAQPVNPTNDTLPEKSHDFPLNNTVESKADDIKKQEPTEIPTKSSEKPPTASVSSEVENPESDQEIQRLTEEIMALKSELENKDKRLLQLEETAKTPESGSENSTSVSVSVLTQKVHELEQTLEQTEEERDRAQEQLEGFLSKISSMKTVFQNFKATQEELEEVKQELVEANEEKIKSEEENKSIKAKLDQLKKAQQNTGTERETHEAEKQKFLAVIENLKSEALDLNSECDRLSQLMGTLRREFQAKEESLQDEKYSLENEVGRLNKKLSEQRNVNSELELVKEEAVIENKNLVLAAEELKERLEDKDRELLTLRESANQKQEMLEVKITELERTVEGKTGEIDSKQAKITALEQEIVVLQEKAAKSAQELESLQKVSEKVQQLEEDVHSKQLIIGKLRHEAIILNEHLTKSISMLKQKSGDTETTVDRELVSNMILNFLQIPRGDTKKFEALSLIGGLLSWDDEKKIQAGLMHSAKNDESKPQRSGLISLWTDFLDKESSKK